MTSGTGGGLYQGTSANDVIKSSQKYNDDHDEIIARAQAGLQEFDKLVGKQSKKDAGSPSSTGDADDDGEHAIPVQQWIDWYLNIPGNEFLVPLTMGFLLDQFSMFEFTGEEPQNPDPGIDQNNFDIINNGIFQEQQQQLRKVQKNLQFPPEAHKMIKGMAPKSLQQLNDPQFQQTYQQAVDLYGMVHARFIQSKDGLNRMRKKFEAMEFGTCPRVQCNQSIFKDMNGMAKQQVQPVLPIGMSSELNVSKVKVFCPRCQDIFVPKGQRSVYATGSKGCKTNLDGAYFGPSFPQIFLLNFYKESQVHMFDTTILSIKKDESKKNLNKIPEYGPQPFEPTLYGFKLHDPKKHANKKPQID